MGKRRKGRILAFQALFAWETADNKEQALKDLLDFSWAEKKPPADPEALFEGGGKAEPREDSSVLFSRLLVAGTVENIEAVDATIRRHLVNWDFSRLTNADKALLRLSVYELLFKTAPPRVVIDEAVDISREFGTDDSYRFINGVLDGVKKTIQDEPFLKKGEKQ
jgi:N utilization substance protein B